ncbi:alpha/beta hydrolase [Aestuariicella hydrocarbonica]|uniref:Alpha/beta hydrolase n=1 Tax=Pseudomaricurvus hydrocarbonicus TaxID=1470433 RepID=A0A9E5MML1_9GAMM|nr:alpha/beta hydrolase [Aestuariicella hydrocarbonica]NHO67014.1 alpha/beta hydrolase [Aestuariicella hydrocarbonica]
MTQATINDLTLEYETFGNPKNPTILLIMGLGSQLIHWPKDFCQQLADRHYFVIRYDNRDAGLSTKMQHAKTPSMKRVAWSLLFRSTPKLPYTLKDMAQDAVALLTYLNREKAHIVGASMGGMIAQLVTIHFPQRVLSLTSIMSTTGNRSLPKPDPAAIVALTPPKATVDQQAIIEHLTGVWKILMSPGYPSTDEDLRAHTAFAFHRNYCPQGTRRQLAACLCAPDRRSQLQQLSVPTAVIHGSADPLVPFACGEDTARNIPGAELFAIEGMAHDFPETLIPRIAGIIESVIKRSQAVSQQRASEQ